MNSKRRSILNIAGTVWLMFIMRQWTLHMVFGVLNMCFVLLMLKMNWWIGRYFKWQSVIISEKKIWADWHILNNKHYKNLLNVVLILNTGSFCHIADVQLKNYLFQIYIFQYVCSDYTTCPCCQIQILMLLINPHSNCHNMI